MKEERKEDIERNWMPHPAIKKNVHITFLLSHLTPQ
jgi:hypothetical protein